MTPLEYSYLYFPQFTRLALEADAMLRRFEYEYEALMRQFASSDSSPEGSLSSTPQEDVSSRPFRLIDETAVPDYLDSRLSRIVSPSAMASGSSSFSEEWPSSDEGEESFDGWESSSAEDEVPASTRKRKQARKTKCKHARSPRVQRTARRPKTATKAASTPVVAPPAEPAALPRKRKRKTVPQPSVSPAASCSGAKRRRQPATLASTAEEGEDDTDEILDCLWPECEVWGSAMEVWKHVHATHLPKRPVHVKGPAEHSPMVCRWPHCGIKGTVTSVWSHLQQAHLPEKKGAQRVICRLPKCRFLKCTVARSDYRRHVLARHWRTEKMLPTCEICGNRTRSDMKRRRHTLRACLMLLMTHKAFLRGQYPPHNYPKRTQHQNNERLEDEDVPTKYDFLDDEDLPIDLVPVAKTQEASGDNEDEDDWVDEN